MSKKRDLASFVAASDQGRQLFFIFNASVRLLIKGGF